MRRELVALAALLIAAPLSAQTPGMGNDPTKTIKGSGELPSGWMMRFDPPRRPGTPTPAPTAVSVVLEGKGYHVKSGPAAIYYDARKPAEGSYSASATFSQATSMKHEAYGLVIGGDHLQDSTQSYLYFIVRPMDAAVLINHRNGDDAKKIVKLVEWTPNQAVHKEDPVTGAATNHLEIRVTGDSVHFLANDTQVHAFSRAELQSQGVAVDGLAGVRVNHNLDLQVEGFTVTAQPPRSNDATTAVATAPVPRGWTVRMDAKDASKTAKFVAMGPGYHVTSGGAGIYYRSKDVQKSAYTVSAEFRQTTKNLGHGDHGEAFGLFAGGRHLNDPLQQTYFYLEVRQDGMYLINHRAGADVHKIVDWTSSPAIHKFDDMPNAKNDLAIKVAGDSVRFLVNGTQVRAISRQEITDASGEAGFRVNHNLDVHVANFRVTSGKH